MRAIGTLGRYRQMIYSPIMPMERAMSITHQMLRWSMDAFKQKNRQKRNHFPAGTCVLELDEFNPSVLCFSFFGFIVGYRLCATFALGL